MPQVCDCLVLGIGGFGSSAAFHAAKLGARVIGLEQFGIGHDRGSSHGETRVFRKAYFEHPDYVPLLQRAYALWHELQDASHQPLYRECGLLLAGPGAGTAVPGARRAAELHGLSLDTVSPADVAERFPGFRVPDGFEVVFEPEAGYLLVEACVTAHVRAAEKAGAEIRTGERVLGWSSDGHNVHVRTDRDEYEAPSLIVTAGGWTGPLLASLKLPISVLRKVQLWLPVRDRAYHEADGCPAYFFEMPEGEFYGFPSRDGATVKVAEHSGGLPVLDPHAINRAVNDADSDPVLHFARRVMPAAAPAVAAASVCMYSMTPDGHFLVDRHPEFANVVLGAGFSGHGFKFTSILGQALAELALRRTTNLPIEFLSTQRLAP